MHDGSAGLVAKINLSWYICHSILYIFDPDPVKVSTVSRNLPGDVQLKKKVENVELCLTSNSRKCMLLT